MKYITTLIFLFLPFNVSAMSEAPEVNKEAYNCAKGKSSTVRFTIDGTLFLISHSSLPILIESAPRKKIKYKCHELDNSAYKAIAVQSNHKVSGVFGAEFEINPNAGPAETFTLRFGILDAVDWTRVSVPLPLVTNKAISFLHSDNLIVSLSFFNDQPAIEKLGKQESVKKAKEFFETLIVKE